MTDDRNRLAYSTEQPIQKTKKVQKSVSQQLHSQSKQGIHVRLDRKGRGGKSVTLIEGLRLSYAEKESLLKQLKARLGTGGAIKDFNLEIQGDHRDAVIAFLEALNFRPKRSGG